MASFRILNQAPQYLLADGRVNAGGKLFFYETDLSTPKDTWSDEAMSTLNSNPVVMDAAGRTLTDVWGDGEYGVVMTDSADVVIWTRNNVRASNADEVTIPALETDKALFNNGSFLQWRLVLQVPDPTGHADEILKSDGTIPFWGPAPETPELDIVIDNSPITIQVGDGSDDTKGLMQAGTSTAPANPGGTSTSIPVVFSTSYSATPGLSVTAQANTQPGGPIVSGYIGLTTTGFTAVFDVAEGAPEDQFITNPVPFSWISVGTKEVT